MASCMGIDVYKDITSRLHGYGRVLLVVKSPAWMHLISSRLFSRCAGTSFSNGLRALACSHERRWVCPLVLDTIGRILITGQFFLCLDKVVEPLEIGVCGDEALPDKRGYLVL